MDLTIRGVRAEDAAPIAELLNALIREGVYTALDQPLSVDAQADFIRRFPGRGVFHVAVRDGSRELLGLQDVTPIAPESGVGEISTFVRLDSHRQGIGRRLCQATFPAAREKGFATIGATIRADNPGAIAFYSSQGFTLVRIARNDALVGGRHVDRARMEKSIA